ncbi:MAG: HlyD family efflux transporter periplasmic adaptor subunit [Pseudomonadota bacterium]
MRHTVRMMNEVILEANPSPSAHAGGAMDRVIARQAPAWWKQRAVQAVLAAIALALCLWFVVPERGSVDVSSSEITIGSVGLAAFDDYLPVRASVAPAVTRLVGVMSGGQVDALLVQDGAMVAQGQPLATLANPELRLQVMTQEAQIASQLGGLAGENLGISRSQSDRETQLSQAEYDLIQAQRQHDTRKQLHDRGFISDAGMAKYIAAVAFQRERVAQLRESGTAARRFTQTQSQRLEETRARLQSTLDALRSSLDALVVRAPMAGRLTNFDLQPGQTLKPGDEAGQVDSESEWKLLAEIDEFHLDRLQMGQTAVTSDGAAMTVARVLPTVSNGRFRIELTFIDALEQRLNRGQTLDVRITLGAAKQAVIAPVGGWLSEPGNSVFVLDGREGQARRQPITIGRQNPHQVEILAGLEPGDKIITTNLSHISSDVLNIR